MCIRRFWPPTARPLGMGLSHFAVPLLGAALMAFTWGASAAIGQEDAADEEQKVADPEPVSLETPDGVTLSATYYPGPTDKQTVPVILLHTFKGSGNGFAQLVPSLRKKGYAVLVPDLRGHGDSTRRKGTSLPLAAATMSRAEFVNIVRFDLPTFKQFLVQKNNAGELNIEKLCVVGAEMGASAALNWTAFDWSLPPEGNRKQGQDVKAMVLISPDWSTPGLPLRAAMTARPLTIMIWDSQLKEVFKEPREKNFMMPVTVDFRKEVSVMILYGQGNSKATRDGKRLVTMFKHHHPEPPANEKAEKQDLFYGALKTTLQGTKLLNAKEFKLDEDIVRFIERRVAKRSFPWAERRDPYEGR